MGGNTGVAGLRSTLRSDGSYIKKKQQQQNTSMSHCRTLCSCLPLCSNQTVSKKKRNGDDILVCHCDTEHH